MRLYLDSAYVANCYLPDPDGAKVRQMVRGENELHSSAWCLAEMACLFHRQIREKHLTRQQVLQLEKHFYEDVENGVWTLWPVSEGLLRSVAAAARRLGSEVFLRTGDAIHLVTAGHAGFSEIWSNDRHLLRAAPHFGLRGRSV